MRRETYSTPGAVRLNLEIPAGRIEVETSNTDETRVELEALGGNEFIRELVESARIELLRRGDGHEVVVEVKMRHGFWISFGRGPDLRLRVRQHPAGARRRPRQDRERRRAPRRRARRAQRQLRVRGTPCGHPCRRSEHPARLR